MAAVNWNLPSTGFVSDPSPSLDLANDTAVALRAFSAGVALDAVSKSAEALRARARKTVAANMRSDEFIGSTSYGPKATGSVGVNESRPRSPRLASISSIPRSRWTALTASASPASRTV